MADLLWYGSVCELKLRIRSGMVMKGWWSISSRSEVIGAWAACLHCNSFITSFGFEFQTASPSSLDSLDPLIGLEFDANKSIKVLSSPIFS